MVQQSLAVVVLLFALPGVISAEDTIFTGNDLLAWCEDNGPRHHYCLGFIQGAYDGWMSARVSMKANIDKRVCLPEGVTIAQGQKIVVKWMNDNPEFLHKAASAVVIGALDVAFPCPESKPSQ